METWLLIIDICLGLVGVFLVYRVLKCICCIPSQEALLEEDFVGNFYDGLQRQNLEDPHGKVWKCVVCGFANKVSTPCCLLCSTQKTSSVNGRFTLEQQSASQRKQWLRGYDSKGNAMWQTLTANAQGYFIIRYNNQRLSWDKLCSVDAGENLPLWKYDYLVQMQNISFSTKYASFYSTIESLGLPYTKFSVYRDTVFESIDLLLEIAPTQLCTKTKIIMLGESGVDAGGLQREWYSLAFGSIFDPTRGLFIINNKQDNSYMINPNSAHDHGENHLIRFHAIGRLLARAIIEGHIIPCHLSVPLFKSLLGYPLAQSDIIYIDATLLSSLEYVQTTMDVENLALDFTVATGNGNDTVELIENGQNIAVTMANRDEYVTCMVKYLLFDRIAPQLTSFLRGFYEVLPLEDIAAFDYKELELLMCGTMSDIDLEDWRRNTKVAPALFSTGCDEWFWSILSKMTPEEHHKLLQFTTGSSRVPMQGFRGLTSFDGRLCPFTLEAIHYKKGVYPKVHTCFNRIDLPLYPTKELMNEGIRALLNIENAEFTMV